MDNLQPLQINNTIKKNIIGNNHRKVLRVRSRKYGIENTTLIWHQATSIVVVRQKLLHVQLFVKPFISKSLIGKAASQVVSGGNELVSSEVLEFVGFVGFFCFVFCCCYYSIQHLGLSSFPQMISQVSAWPLVLHREHILASPIGPKLSNCLSFK